jgi:hypothetical protein
MSTVASETVSVKKYSVRRRKLHPTICKSGPYEIIHCFKTGLHKRNHKVASICREEESQFFYSDGTMLPNGPYCCDGCTSLHRLHGAAAGPGIGFQSMPGWPCGPCRGAEKSNARTCVLCPIDVLYESARGTEILNGRCMKDFIR